MHYVNLAAAIDTLAEAMREQQAAFAEYMAHRNTLHRERTMNALSRESGFMSGISYAIGMMLDPATAAIIEQAARERAEETTS